MLAMFELTNAEKQATFLCTTNFHASLRIATFNLNLVPTCQLEQEHVGVRAWLGAGSIFSFML